VSAYAGAAQFISNKDYLTAAAVVLSTEARHAAWVASAVNKGTPWSGALDAPLGLNEVYSLAAPFITSCPSTNPVLPVKAFPALAIANPVPGVESAVDASMATSPPTHIAFFVGLAKTFVPIVNGKVLIPKGLGGQIYAVATTSGDTASDSTIVAGPAPLQISWDSNGNAV